jgi:hypothetical protein
MIDTTSACGIEYVNCGSEGPWATLPHPPVDPPTFTIESHFDESINIAPPQAAELSVKLAAFARENGVEPGWAGVKANSKTSIRTESVCGAEVVWANVNGQVESSRATSTRCFHKAGPLFLLITVDYDDVPAFTPEDAVGFAAELLAFAKRHGVEP